MGRRLVTRGLGPLAPAPASDPAPSATGLDHDPAEDLDSAVEAFYATASAVTALAPSLFNGQAADQASLPYVVFRIGAGGPAFTSDTSYWVDQRIRFECFAGHASRANRISEAVLAAFGGVGGVHGVSLSYADGATSPFVLVGRSRAAERPRGRDGARVFRSTVEYSARARLGRPS